MLPVTVSVSLKRTVVFNIVSLAEIIEIMNGLLTLICHQAGCPEDGSGEGSRERTAGANHWERSERDFPGKALLLWIRLIAALCFYMLFCTLFLFFFNLVIYIMMCVAAFLAMSPL